MEEPFRYKGSLLFVVKKFASFVIRFTALAVTASFRAIPFGMALIESSAFILYTDHNFRTAKF